MKYLLADLAYEIRNGFLNVFPDADIIDCNYHVQARIDKKLKEIKDERQRKLLKRDICILQLCQSKEVFDNAANLFVVKWQAKQAIFVKYFKDTYIDKFCNWFEGNAMLAPSTNVAQESTHAKLKMTFTNHRRVSIQEMKVLAGEIVKNWSLDLKIEKPYQKKIVFTDREIIKGYLWAKKPIDVIKDPDETVHVQSGNKSLTVFWVCLDEKEKMTLEKINAVKDMDYESFDSFSKVNFQVRF
jgi:hypothetical protein